MAKHSYDPNYKLRIVILESLTPGQQIAQALHAAIEFVHDHPGVEQNWHSISNSVVAMNASATQLQELLARCQKKQIRYSTFEEPDMEHMLTAVAIEPTRNGKRVTSNYRLALRDL
jgi:hypothetical protein